MSKCGELLLNRLSKQKNLNLSNNNSKKLLNPLHSLIVRKMNKKEKSNEVVTKEIYEYMNLPEKFFSPNSKVIIGKKIKLKDMKEVKPELTISKKLSTSTKRMSLYRKFSYNFRSQNNNNFESNLRKSMSNNLMSFKENRQSQLNNDKYDIIDNIQLKKIFNKYKTCISQNNDKKNIIKIKKIKNNNNINTNISNNNLISKNTETSEASYNINISQSLTVQNKRLNIKQKLDNKIKKISKHLSKLINKKENDLLLNRIDDYCFKKELLKEIDYNKPLDDEFGAYKWNISLRRPKDFEGIRKSYINLTRDENPFWGIVVEKYPKIKELKIKPGSIAKNKKILEKFKKTYFPFINYNNYKNLENIDAISVKGKNLFNIEYDREINNSKGKKKLYKTFSDEGGKIINNNEINNLFGEKIFYENYSNSNLLSTNNTNVTNNNNAYHTVTSKFISKNKKVYFKDFPNSSLTNDDSQRRTFFKNRSLPEYK